MIIIWKQVAKQVYYYYN